MLKKENHMQPLSSECEKVIQLHSRVLRTRLEMKFLFFKEKVGQWIDKTFIKSSLRIFINLDTSFSTSQAYRLRQANSVKIAKIVAFTVILSSFILGSFMLGSTYLQARATCDQVSALDAILDKELMLETMQQVREIFRFKLNSFAWAPWLN